MRDTAIVLGTVQWGRAYGVANRAGQTPESEVAKILAVAADAGITTLDTARVYGTAEAVIGRSVGRGWRVVTKLAPSVAGPDADSVESAERARRSLAESRSALKRELLDGVLLHRAAQRVSSGGGAWIELQRQRDRGLIRAIGVSVVSVDEAGDAIEDADVQLIQVPASLLDQRLARSGFFESAAARGVEVFVRSIFLQGAAHLAVNRLPPYLGELRPVLAALDRLAFGAGIQRAALFLAWARLRLPSARIIVGCDTASQLQQNLSNWVYASTLAPLVSVAADAVPTLPDEVLDPWRWPGSGVVSSRQRNPSTK